MMRALRREAPGRTMKSDNRITAAAATPRLEEKHFTLPLLKVRGSSSHKLERPLPACFVEKMNHDSAQEQSPIAPCGLAILVVGSFKRPVDEHRPPNDIFLGDESPIAAVQAHTAVIAHGEVMIGRDHN